MTKNFDLKKTFFETIQFLEKCLFFKKHVFLPEWGPEMFLIKNFEKFSKIHRVPSHFGQNLSKLKCNIVEELMVQWYGAGFLAVNGWGFDSPWMRRE